MKKILCIILAMIFCLGAVSCGKEGDEPKVARDEFVFVIENRSGENIKGINLTYSVFDEKIGSAFIGNGGTVANGGKLEKTFKAEEFKDCPSLADFKAECTVINEKDEQKGSINVIKLVAEYGKVYTFIMDGNSETGFHFSKISTIDK